MWTQPLSARLLSLEFLTLSINSMTTCSKMLNKALEWKESALAVVSLSASMATPVVVCIEQSVYFDSPTSTLLFVCDILFACDVYSYAHKATVATEGCVQVPAAGHAFSSSRLTALWGMGVRLLSSSCIVALPCAALFGLRGLDLSSVSLLRMVRRALPRSSLLPPPTSLVTL